MENKDENSWDEILNCRYRLFEIEKSIYTDSQTVANGPLMFAQYISDGLRKGDVPEKLAMYKEAVYGKNPKVKAQIISRIYSLGRLVRYYFNYILPLQFVNNAHCHIFY